jgi:hypothetical protein
MMDGTTQGLPTVTVTLALARGEAPRAFPVAELSGEEALGQPFRFELGLELPAGCDSAAIPIGARALLELAGRRIEAVLGGVTEAGPRRLVLTLVPPAWLLSLTRRSRSFERLEAPEVAEACARGASPELPLEVALDGDYPRRRWTIQHRESDLAFLSRTLEREGITAYFGDDGRVRLSDTNAALPAHGELLQVGDLSVERRPLPRRLILLSTDPARPSLPLEAEAEVCPDGLGELELHDEPFATPEDGARAAQIAADRERVTGVVIRGTSRRTLSLGRVRCADRDMLVTGLRHRLEAREGAVVSSFRAIPAGTRFRPPRLTPEPKLVGLHLGEVAPRVASGSPDSPIARDTVDVRDQGGAGEAREIPVAGARGGDVALAAGTPVVWGCVDGDPERPLVTSWSAAPAAGGAERLVLRTTGGATIELGGAGPRPLGDELGELEGDARPAPEVAHHGTANPDGSVTSSAAGTANTYLRFAVPHSKGMSYIRLGDAGPNLGSFSEDGKYGEIVRDGWAEKLNQNWATNGPGVFDYTDGSRTLITKGDWEDVVKGEGRLVVYGGGDDPIYEMVVGSKKTFIQSQNPEWSYSAGAKVDFFGGLKLDLATGLAFGVMLGGKVAVDVGYSVDVFAGNKVSAVFADSWELRQGEELGIASTVDRRASNKIQYSITGPGTPNTTPDAMFFIGAALTAVAAVPQVALGLCATEFDDGDEISAGVSAGVGALLAIAYGIQRSTSKEREVADGNPIISINKEDPTATPPEKATAALRSDDWVLLLTEDFACLGKNKKYGPPPGGVISVTSLQRADAGAAVIIEEPANTTNSVVTIQAGTGATLASITVKFDKTIEIKADTSVTIDAPTIELKSSAGDAAVKITGNLEVSGTSKLTGDVTMSGGATVGGSAVQVK